MNIGPNISSLKGKFISNCFSYIDLLLTISPTPPMLVLWMTKSKAISMSFLWQAHRQRELERLRAANAARKSRALRRNSEPLPELLWRSPHLDALIGDAPFRRAAGPHEAPLFGNASVFKSQKMRGRYIVCSSTPELHLAYHCEFSPDVEWYVEQPFAIRYRCAGRTTTYAPDMLVCRLGRRVVMEAKTAEGALAEKWAAREPYIREALSSMDLEFEVVTSATLSVQPRLQNIRRRLEDRLRPVPICGPRVKQFLSASGPRTLAVVSALTGAAYYDLRVLIAHDFIDADLDQPLDEDTVLHAGH